MTFLNAMIANSSALAIGGFVLSIVYYFVISIYNVFFHPLSKYPGPKIAATSHIPHAIQIFRGKAPFWIKKLHDKYDSDVVRISPHELSFINASAWKDFHGTRQGHLSLEKDPIVYGKPPNSVASLLTANRADHTRMKRVLGHAFSDRAIRDQEPIVESYVDLLIKRLREQTYGSESGKVDISNWFRWTAFDITGDLSFGESFGCLQDQKLHAWAKMIDGFLRADVCLAACKRFSTFQYFLPYLVPKKMREMMKDHWSMTVEKLSRRMKLGEKRPDFISPIIKYNEAGKGLTEGEIQSNASLFIVAGSDTTATVLTGTIYYLLQNPECLAKVAHEVRSAFKAESETTSQSVGRLPYTIACLDETHRIYPAVLVGQAVVTPPEGDMMGDRWIPGKTGLNINMYAAYRSARNFLHPETYIPERWLGDPRFANDQREVFHPFSYGHRACLGRNLGTLEPRLILARLIYNFDIELCREETGENWLDQLAYVTWFRKALWVRLKPRDRI